MEKIRVTEWKSFSEEVVRHIKTYTIPQYGDYPDNVSRYWSPEYIKNQLDRYIQRIGRGQRGLTEAKRDCLKIAHYACMLNTILDYPNDTIGLDYTCASCGRIQSIVLIPDDIKYEKLEYLQYLDQLCDDCYTKINKE